MASTQAERDKDAKILYPELKANYNKLTTQFVSQENIDKLGGLIAEYGKNVGGGDKTGYQELHPDYLPIKDRITSFRDKPEYQTNKAFKAFAKALLTLVNIAWSLQLVSTQEGDQILKQIWELCGEIANEVKV